MKIEYSATNNFCMIECGHGKPEKTFSGNDLIACIRYLREGDELFVKSLSDLGCNISELLNNVQAIKESGATFEVMDLIEMGVNAERIIDIIAHFRDKPNLEPGTSPASDRTYRGGTKPKLSPEQLLELVKLRREGHTIKQLMAAFKISKNTVILSLARGGYVNVQQD